MLRNLAVLISIGCTLYAPSQICIADEPVSIWDYLGQKATHLAAQLPPLATTRDGWEEQRAQTIRRLNEALGLPDRAPMKAAVTGKQQEGDLILEEVAYHWAENTYATATVIRDATATGPLPALVVSPGWKGHYSFRAYRPFVDDLARHGILVLFIDDPRTGRRHAPAAGLYAVASAAGTPVAGIQVFDALRGLDYLQTRPDVDAAQIGIGGLGAGAIQSYLAAALEPQFKFVIAVGGTTTFESLVQTAGPGRGPQDPSAFLFGILNFTDMDRLAGCIAPRPVLVAGSGQDSSWPAEGHDQVLTAMTSIYHLYEASENLCELPGEVVDDFAPYAARIIQWLEKQLLAKPANATTTPKPVGEPAQPNYSMLLYMQRRIEEQADALPIEPSHVDELAEASAKAVEWLATICPIPSRKPGDDQVLDLTETDGLVTERLALCVDAKFRCPAVLVRSATPVAAKRPAVVLSHDDRQSVAVARITEATRRLATLGYYVIAVDHASVDPQSAHSLSADEEPSFYGDEAARFYGPASAVGLTPLGLRIAEIGAAVDHLCHRDEVDSQRIVVAGVGIGSVSGCLAAAMNDRIAGVALVDATTARHWCVESAPNEQHFFHLMPVLPGMLRHADLDLFAASVAPRPMLLVRRKGGWPRAGIDRVLKTAQSAYGLQQAADALVGLGPREVIEHLESGTPQGIQRQLLDAASTLMPIPPQAGVMGSLAGLKSRRTADSASGLVWIVSEMDGYEQELTGDGFRLTTWSFFNDNGAAQQGRVVTPVILRQKGDTFLLTGIGATRSNDGSGLQSFDFEPVQGTDTVGDGYFFGWHTGDLQGRRNPGVIEFEDAPDSLMTILTATGQMTDQPLVIGNTYRRQSQFRRRYSVMAVAKKH
ncbi:MAG: dienelactone hydrolase family protein [Pirellulales bacterium]